MDSWIPVLLFLGLLLGFGVLVLACGIQSHEEEREKQRADPRQRPDLLAAARFFGRNHYDELAEPVALVVDRAVLARVEEFLRSNMSLVEVSLAESIPESDSEGSAGDSRRESLLARLESFLHREQAVVSEFISNPSVARLYETVDLVPSRS